MATIDLLFHDFLSVVTIAVLMTIMVFTRSVCPAVSLF